MTRPTRASDSVWHVQHLHTPREPADRKTCARSNANHPPLPGNTPVKTADVFIYSIFNGAVKPESLLVSSGLGITFQLTLDGA